MTKLPKQIDYCLLLLSSVMLWLCTYLNKCWQHSDVGVNNGQHYHITVVLAVGSANTLDLNRGSECSFKIQIPIQCILIYDVYVSHPVDINEYPGQNVLYYITNTCKKASIHQVNTMLATSKNVLFPGPNHLLTNGADDPMLKYCPSTSEGSSAPVVSRWLGPRNRTFFRVASTVVTWWIVPFLRSVIICKQCPLKRKFECIISHSSTRKQNTQTAQARQNMHLLMPWPCT